MLRSYLHGVASKLLAERKAQVAGITTREQYEVRRAEVRSKFKKVLGSIDFARGPLNLRKMGTLDQGDYRIEKIIYESTPNYFVPALLFIPQTGKPPYPAVLNPIGHTPSSKNDEFFQDLSIGLAKQGFVVLAYDPMGQGERRIYYDRDLQDSKAGYLPSVEHSMVGIRSLLGGFTAAGYEVLDGIRSIDLLESLPEVDRGKIGVTGCSGGGTQTVFLAALDDRLKVIAPSCYVTSWEEQLKGAGPQDAEQQFPDQLLEGLEQADLISLLAPKPYLITSSRDDFFPVEGTRQAFEEARRIYSLFGAEERMSWFLEPGEHGLYKAGREEVYFWMNRWLRGDTTAKVTPEPAFQTLYEEDLNCTPTGQLATSLGGETASTLDIKRLETILPSRPPLATAKDLDRVKKKLREQILAVTRFDRSSVPLNPRTAGEVRRPGYRIERLLFDSDAGRYVPALLATPDGSRRPQVAIYVDDRGKDAGFSTGGSCEQLAQMGYVVLALDTAGVGETASDWYLSQLSTFWFGQEKTAWLALMVGRPLVGLRMADIIAGLDLLAEKGLLGTAGALGVAHGAAGVDLLHAAVLESRISGVLVEDGLLSYRAVAAAPLHRRVFESILPGVLTKYDLDDLAAATAPRPLWLVNMRSPLGRTVFRKDVESAYTYTQQAYRAAEAPANLHILLRRDSTPITHIIGVGPR
jgi:dienelactone hydrolase